MQHDHDDPSLCPHGWLLWECIICWLAGDSDAAWWPDDEAYA